MLLNIKTGHRGITKRKQDEIVFLVCEANDIVSKCSKWLFTDGHAKDALSKFYTDLVDLEKLDWSIINKKRKPKIGIRENNPTFRTDFKNIC